MICYLHIGTEKTGTKSIQSFLNINKDILEDNGFIYTNSLGKENNYLLPVACYDVNKRDEMTAMHNIKSDNDMILFQAKIIKDLKTEIQKKNRNKLNILFSSEQLQSRLTNTSELLRLKKNLYGIGVKKIYIMIYLREPGEIANSLYSTAIRYGETSDTPFLPESDYIKRICDHWNTLEVWGNIFGEENLIPKIYNKNEFVNGSILLDFLSVIGIKKYTDFIFPDNKNESLSASGIEILRRFNKQVPFMKNGIINQERDDIIAFFDKHFSNESYFMSTYLYESYSQFYSNSLELVRKKYFPARDFLFPQKNNPEQTISKIPNNELDIIANLISDIWIEKQYQLDKIRSNSGFSLKRIFNFFKRFN